MKTRLFRTVIALIVLAALIIPQATPVQSAPLRVEKTIDLQSGDVLTITCPTKMIRQSASDIKVKLLCRSLAVTSKATADTTTVSTATAIATATSTVVADVIATATHTVAPTASQQLVDLNPLDVLIVNCPTKMIRKSISRTKLQLLCRPIPVTQSPEHTATHSSESIATLTSESTATQSSEPTAIHTSMPTATQTAIADATQQSVPTVAVSPSATATIITGGLIQPYKDAPTCPTHNPNAWHGVWDYVRGCHYDHTHGDDPSLANKYFGALGAYWGGSTISYPFNSGVSENTTKHAGYKINVRMPDYHPYPPCGVSDNTDITGEHSDNCVIASRVEYHGLGSLMGTVGRFHSYWMEIYICAPPYRQPQDCGIMRTGGLLDFGELHAPNYGPRIVRPGGTLDFGNGVKFTYPADASDLPATSGEPYIFTTDYTVDNLSYYRRGLTKRPGTVPGSIFAAMDAWSSNDFDCQFKEPDGACHNLYTHILFQVGDSFTLTDTQDLNKVHLICYGEPGCEYDGSLTALNEIAVIVSEKWQSEPGFAMANTFSDKWGNPIVGCTVISANCVPFVLEHAPIGVAASRGDNKCNCDLYEYDVYFNGKPSGWIEFPN